MQKKNILILTFSTFYIIYRLLVGFHILTLDYIVIPFAFIVYIPVIISAYHYRIKGGLISSIFFMVLNFSILYFINPQPQNNMGIILAFNAGFLITGLILGYISQLLYKLRLLNQQKDMIVRESHHRIKNNLNFIFNIISVESMSEKGKILDKFSDLQNRIISISEIHDKIYNNEDLTKIGLNNYITDLVAKVIKTTIKTNDIKIEINILDIVFGAHESVSIGVIVTELLTNALKYGLLTVEEPQIIINFSGEKRSNHLTFSHNGTAIEPHIDFINAESMGFQIINSFVQQLNGTIKISDRTNPTFDLTFNMAN
ncbi:MAG: hypothetical protein HQ541_16000 [Mariniphaga sp.]|nr:hypothetical protein [Mariniphaga sp.]